MTTSMTLPITKYIYFIQSIAKEKDYDMSIGKDPLNKPKNRFKNIIPCKNTSIFGRL